MKIFDLWGLDASEHEKIRRYSMVRVVLSISIEPLWRIPHDDALWWGAARPSADMAIRRVSTKPENQKFFPVLAAL
ncbi:MAG: hypothetical protein PHQ81_01655 [Methanofollis sp.]|nr:hypothetical protein [Methanofollis sp.]